MGHLGILIKISPGVEELLERTERIHAVGRSVCRASLRRGEADEHPPLSAGSTRKTRKSLQLGGSFLWSLTGKRRL